METLIIIGAKYLYLASILAFAYLFYLIPKAEKKRFIIFTLLTFTLAYLVGVLARSLYFNPRPFVVEGIEPLIPHQSDNGFPSDHSLLAGAMASVAIIYRRKIGIFLVLLAVCIGISRVLAGVHHLVDILTSFAIAALSTLVVYLFLLRRKRDKITE